MLGELSVIYRAMMIHDMAMLNGAEGVVKMDRGVKMDDRGISLLPLTHLCRMPPNAR